MDNELLIRILKIIKKSKQIVIDSFYDTDYKIFFLDFEDTFNDIEILTKELSYSIKQEAKTFNRQYQDNKQMVEAIKQSISNINKPLIKLSKLYISINSIDKSNDELQNILLLKVIEKILNNYLYWIEKLELAILGNKTEVIFIPDIDNELKLIELINNHIKQDNSCLFPFLGGLGLGFLLE